jgi:hypothetical protein
VFLRVDPDLGGIRDLFNADNNMKHLHRPVK